jgi:hypothetical protein
MSDEIGTVYCGNQTQPMNAHTYKIYIFKTGDTHIDHIFLYIVKMFNLKNINDYYIIGLQLKRIGSVEEYT